jgi:TolB protein
MDSYPFAHTSPIWINYKGSTEPSSEKEAKEKLIFAMQTLEKIAVDRYKDGNISNLLTQFSEAKAALLE